MTLKWSNEAVADVARLHDFLAQVNPPAAARTVKILTEAPKQLLNHPPPWPTTDPIPATRGASHHRRQLRNALRIDHRTYAKLTWLGIFSQTVHLVRQEKRTTPGRFCVSPRPVLPSTSCGSGTHAKSVENGTKHRTPQGVDAASSPPQYVPGNKMRWSTVSIWVWPQNAIVVSNSLWIISSARVTPAWP